MSHLNPRQYLYIDNDNLLTLEGLKNTATDAYVNDATVTVTVNDSAGSPVAGESWPLAMGYLSASDGNYRATLQNDITLTNESEYTAIVTAVGDSIDAAFDMRLIAIRRGISA